MRKYYSPIKAWASRTLKAHKKKCSVQLTVEQLVELARRTPNCPLCGVHHGSLDRKDGGHNLNAENVWIICLRCNLIKGDRSYHDFVNYCKRVVNAHWEFVHESEFAELVKTLEHVFRNSPPALVDWDEGAK